MHAAQMEACYCSTATLYFSKHEELCSKYIELWYCTVASSVFAAAVIRDTHRLWANLKHIESLIPQSILATIGRHKCAVPCIMLQLLVTSCFMFLSWGPTKGQQTEYIHCVQSKQASVGQQHAALCIHTKVNQQRHHIMRGFTKGVLGSSEHALLQAPAPKAG